MSALPWRHADILDSPKAIEDSECVEAYLAIKGDPPHCPFWWREWAEADQGKNSEKGALSIHHYHIDTGTIEGDVSESPYQYTLAHAHFVEYGNNLPVSSDLQLENLDKPCWRTYILSLQAVSESHLIFSDLFS